MPDLIPDPAQPWFVAALVLALVGLLASGRFPADVVFMGALTLLLATGIIDPAQALAGFANPAMATVALLYVVAAGMRHTGAMAMIADRLLGRGPSSPRLAQARLVLPVCGLSAFINNTPIVAMFLPVLPGVAKRGGFSPSLLFMPLSFASILGGVCTLIGTSTNVVVAGLAAQDSRIARPLGLFSISPVGVPIALAGVAYMLLAAPKLLRPRRNGPDDRLASASKQYTAAMAALPGSPVVGRTIQEAGLRHLPGLFLSRIERPDESVVAVGPGEVIRPGDVLVFVGDLDAVVELQQVRGLVPAADEPAAGPRHQRQLTEAVVAPAAPIVDLTIRDAGFRARYGAVVIAVHRHGHRLRGRIGDVTLRAGDTLVLESEPGFAERHRESPDFYLVTERAKSAAPHHSRAWVALAVMAALVLALALGPLPTVTAAMLAAGAMVALRCCTGSQARAAIDLQVLVTIGAAFGLGTAIESTGLAQAVALAMADATLGLGPWAPLAGVYAATLLFTSMMTNNAAAVLMFPIAMDVAVKAGGSPIAYAVTVAVAASCEFSTPIGYQTNLMVMGPGGYRWADYLRFGAPLTLLCAIICIALAPLVY